MFYSPCRTRREFVVPCLVLRQPTCNSFAWDTKPPENCEMLGDRTRKSLRRERTWHCYVELIGPHLLRDTASKRRRSIAAKNSSVSSYPPLMPREAATPRSYIQS